MKRLKKYSCLLGIFFCTALFLNAQKNEANKIAALSLDHTEWEKLDLSNGLIDSIHITDSSIYIDENWNEISRIKYIESYRYWIHEKTLYAHKKDPTKLGVKLEGIVDPDRRAKFNTNLESKKKVYDIIGKKAPELDLTSIEGEKYTTESLKGKVVVLSFWFIQCPPCRREMPELNELVHEYEGQDVVFLGLSLNAEAALQAFLKKTPFDFEIFEENESMPAYGVNAYPTNFVLDKNGTVDFMFVGSQVKGVVKDVLKEKIDQLLK